MRVADDGVSGEGQRPSARREAVAELTREVNDELRKGLRSRLGLREASEARAHAVVRGKLTRYEADVPVGFSANPGQATTATRRLQIAMDIEIVDQTTGRTLFRRAGLSTEGQYAEGQEAAGRKQAIERLVNEVVEGAQSQW